jgi:TPR repeat protein
MYRDGRGVSRDLARAREFFSAAARQGNAEAQQNLAIEEDRSLARFSAAPFRCRSNNTITCVVTENSVLVRDVTVNRGNCPSAAQQSAAIGENPFMAFADILNRATGNNVQLIRVPQMFNFGGGFDFTPFGCPNILEYVITANGQNWTFTVR